MIPRATPGPVILWFAGVGWDEVRGTDRRLVDELASQATVLWCDPPRGAWKSAPADLLRALDRPAPGVIRISVPTVPWSTRWGSRNVAAAHTRFAVRRALRQLDVAPDIQVVASPIQRFIHGIGGTKVYYQTDDWADGAGLMRLSSSWVESNIRVNSWDADVVGAVTGLLLNEVMGSQAPVRSTTRRRVLANGCYEVPSVSDLSLREPVAGLVGQINERLDLEMVGAVAEAGVRVRVVGPRTDKDPGFGRRLSQLLRAPGVDYVGPVPAAAVPEHLARMGVGLTPYVQTPFNRASFPLKTLEYLSAGMAVVSTDLPAVEWLDTDLITVGRNAAQFVSAVEQALRDRHSTELAAARREFTAGHTWASRASDLLDLASTVPTA